MSYFFWIFVNKLKFPIYFKLVWVHEQSKHLRMCGLIDLCRLICLLVPPMEKTMAPHSSTLVWKIPWMEEPGGLQSMGLLRVGHDWATSLSLSTFMHWRRKWQPTPVFLPGESQGLVGAWWAAVYGVSQSWTRLKWLSSSSSKGVYKMHSYLVYVWNACVLYCLVKYICYF